MELMEEQSVVVNEGEITQIMINRPKYLNALNVDVLQSLLIAFDKLNNLKDLKVVTIWGAGDKAFVAGADISTMVDLGKRAIAEYAELGQRVMRAIETCRVPVIAAVNGYALGGGLELALACDLIVASHAAKLGQPEVGLGIIPGFGGTQRLLYRCSIGAVRRLVYTGEVITAEHAYRIGLVDKVCEVGKLTEEVADIVDQIIKKAPLAVSKAKEVINAAREQSLLGGLRHEVEGFLRLFDTVDREEGMRAFMQKREAKFIGR